jgi:hypothetical protein
MAEWLRLALHPEIDDASRLGMAWRGIVIVKLSVRGALDGHLMFHDSESKKCSLTRSKAIRELAIMAWISSLQFSPVLI